MRVSLELCDHALGRASPSGGVARADPPTRNEPVTAAGTIEVIEEMLERSD